MKTPLTISFFLLTILASGQGKASKELQQFIKSNQVDTFILVKSGCLHCKASYERTDKIVDTVTIWLVYQKKGKQTLAVFNDTSQTITTANVETEIFKFIASKRQLLVNKDKYYQEQKHARFQVPNLATFPYETIVIKYGQFNYRHTLVERETDDCGVFQTNEDWFKVELEILKMVDKIKLRSTT